MIYVGIDPSLTSPGLAVLNEDGSLGGVFSLATKKLRGGDRLKAIYEWALERIPADAGTAVIEGYSIGSLNRPFDLGEAGGILRLALVQRALPYTVVPPALVKKYVTGNGLAKKEAVQRSIQLKWGLRFTQDDEADAYVMARLARSLNLRAGSDLHERAVIAKLSEAAPKKTRPPRDTSLRNV